MRLRRIVYTALFTALVCAMTVAVRIPVPNTGGYIHPGDALVIISGIVLGPVLGAVSGGIGSAIADVLGGYAIYSPFTLVIKGMVAFSSGLIYGAISKRKNYKVLPAVLGGIVDILFVAGGYYLCEIPLCGAVAAISSLPANIIQGAGGLVIATLIFPVFNAIPHLRQIMRNNDRKDDG